MTDRKMGRYDKRRVADLFDHRIGAKRASGKKSARLQRSIPEIAGKVAFERLQLKSEDVLLDVGTGTGDKAIAAASLCRQVIGIDISKKSLGQARIKAARKNVNNVIFAYGAFEEPCRELKPASYGVTKILAVYSLHHLPDPLKKKSLAALADLMRRPGRMVIGDIMFFDDPEKHREEFDKVYYDGADTDFPPRVDCLTECLEHLGAKVRAEQIHPLVGVVVADFF